MLYQRSAPGDRDAGKTEHLGRFKSEWKGKDTSLVSGWADGSENEKIGDFSWD